MEQKKKNGLLAEKLHDRKSTRIMQKNKRGDRKGELTDSPDIQTGGDGKGQMTDSPDIQTGRDRKGELTDSPDIQTGDLSDLLSNSNMCSHG